MWPRLRAARYDRLAKTRTKPYGEVMSRTEEGPATGRQRPPQDRRAASRERPWRSMAKAVSWRFVGTLDTFLLSFVLISFLGPLIGMEDAGSKAENLKTAGYIATTEVITKIVLYYLHERGWARIGWNMVAAPGGGQREGRRRSAAKTASWRVLASLDTTLLAFIFTGHVGTAISIGGFEVATKLVLYYFHERAWTRIGVGSV